MYTDLGCQQLAGLVPSLEYYVFGLKAYVLGEVSIHQKHCGVCCHFLEVLQHTDLSTTIEQTSRETVPPEP